MRDECQLQRLARHTMLSDSLLMEAYAQAAQRNVLAALNDKVFFGYWSVCADGQGFGYANTYPSLDGHQLTDALLFLGEVDRVKVMELADLRWEQLHARRA